MAVKEICLNGTVVGCATVTIDGLYAYIKCTCRFKDDKIYAVFLRNDTGSRLLGTCIPQNGYFVLETKIPKKHITSCTTTIYAAEKYTDIAQERICLVMGKPVKSVEKIERSVFRMDNGKPCLLVADNH